MVVKHRATLRFSALARLAADFRRARDEVSLSRLPGRRFRVSRLRAGGLLSPLGLRVGDVIRRVQGRALGSAADAAEVFAGLRPGQILRLEWVRGDALVELTVRLR